MLLGEFPKKRAKLLFFFDLHKFLQYFFKIFARVREFSYLCNINLG